MHLTHNTSNTQKNIRTNTFIHTSEQNAQTVTKSLQRSILHLNNIWNWTVNKNVSNPPFTQELFSI